MNHLGNDRILVTGGAGFIGSALCWGLNQREMTDIILSDHLGEDERWKNLVGLRFVDYLDAGDLIERLEKDPGHLGQVGLVLHLGACSSTTERDVGYLMRNNFEYSKRLAHWALGHGARFVYASSAATYGDGSRGMADTDEDLHRLRPLNAYGYSKHLFDTWAQATGIAGSIVGLKYFNVFGPNENHKGDMRSLVNKSFDRIRETGRVQLFKSNHPDYRDGEQMRDFLYIKDAVEMTLHLALENAPAGLYNLGSGTASTWIELVSAIFDAMAVEPDIEFVDMPEAIGDKYQNYTCADISKLRAAGYRRPVSPLSHAVSDYVKNYLAADALLGTAGKPAARLQAPPGPAATGPGETPGPMPASAPAPAFAPAFAAAQDQQPQPAPDQPAAARPTAQPPEPAGTGMSPAPFHQTPWVTSEKSPPAGSSAPTPFGQPATHGSTLPEAASRKPQPLPAPAPSPDGGGFAPPRRTDTPQAVFTPLDPETPAATPDTEVQANPFGHVIPPPRKEKS